MRSSFYTNRDDHRYYCYYFALKNAESYYADSVSLAGISVSTGNVCRRSHDRCLCYDNTSVADVALIIGAAVTLDGDVDAGMVVSFGPSAAVEVDVHVGATVVGWSWCYVGW
jgi:hypothetical protein